MCLNIRVLVLTYSMLLFSFCLLGQNLKLKETDFFRFDKSEIPKFVPKGFFVFDSIRGNLNEDKYQDCICLLYTSPSPRDA